MNAKEWLQSMKKAVREGNERDAELREAERQAQLREAERQAQLREESQRRQETAAVAPVSPRPTYAERRAALLADILRLWSAQVMTADGPRQRSTTWTMQYTEMPRLLLRLGAPTDEYTRKTAKQLAKLLPPGTEAEIARYDWQGDKNESLRGIWDHGEWYLKGSPDSHKDRFSRRQICETMRSMLRGLPMELAIIRSRIVRVTCDLGDPDRLGSD